MSNDRCFTKHSVPSVLVVLCSRHDRTLGSSRRVCAVSVTTALLSPGMSQEKRDDSCLPYFRLLHLSFSLNTSHKYSGFEFVCGQGNDTY